MRVLLSLVTAAVMFAPLWLWLLLRHALHPVGFWENLATGVVGVAFLGGIQIFLLVLGVVFLWHIWSGR